MYLKVDSFRPLSLELFKNFVKTYESSPKLMSMTLET